MFKRKNISASRLAFFVSLIVASVSAFISFIFSEDLLGIAITFSAILLVCYFLVKYVLQEFIQRRIKLIYKQISNTKATPREEFYNQILPKKTIDDVQQEVEEWAVTYKGEIERLESNEQFRKEFLMNLAHELKTPIFTTQGYIDTLIDGAIHDENVSQQFLQNASRSIDRLAALVSDLDEISKLESDRIPIIKEEFVIQHLVKDVYDELSQRASNKNIKLTIKAGCQDPVEVFADKQKIKQVLVNLVENSIKYGKENGETTAGIYEMGNNDVFVEITDNGAGISEEQVPRVFERFYRTDSARSRNEGGTGLGLAIVKHIIEAHNHTVTCRSKIDVGSSFGFTLDARER